MHVLPRHRWFLLALVILLLGACDAIGGNSDANDLETQSAQLQGTIAGLGTPASTIAVLQMTADRSLALQAELNAAQGTVIALQGTLTTMQLGSGFALGPTPGAPQVTPGQPTTNDGAAVPSGSGTTLTQTTTATGIRAADGCPDGASAIFDSFEDQIYVVTTANNLKAGSVVGARWTANGTIFYDDTACWNVPQDYDSICTYCSIVPDQGVFETGNWTVEISVNGQVLSQAQFQVVDSSASGSTDTTTGTGY